MTRFLVSAFVICCCTATFAAEESQGIQPKIAWYGTLKSGLAEAERSGRPILLVSAAPHCTGVPGIW